jgi:DNA-binding HxlR family transcriptional regulator
MGRGSAIAISKLSQNPFKGEAGLIIRLLFTDPDKLWTGQEIAQDLNLSQAWVNRVLGTLEVHGIVHRTIRGPSSGTQLTQPAELLKKWVHQYQISLNPKHLYLLLDKSPLKQLMAIAEKEKWNFALTGYEAANLIKSSSSGAPPMVYLWPEAESKITFKQILSRLENQHRFIPVGKEANLIILEPFQKDAVFFGSRKIKRVTIVSPVQLVLDLYGLDQGKLIIKSLASFWEENQIPYAF